MEGSKIDPVLGVEPLEFVWKTLDPFLFCVHHEDRYPKANAQFGPAVSLAGRDIGMDFTLKDGFRMYHGDVVPGFPEHPHRGFETVTIVRRGSSIIPTRSARRPATEMATCSGSRPGSGIVHAEMFPLLSSDTENPARAISNLAESSRAPTKWSTRISRCCGTRPFRGRRCSTRRGALPW